MSALALHKYLDVSLMFTRMLVEIVSGSGSGSLASDGVEDIYKTVHSKTTTPTFWNIDT